MLSVTWVTMFNAKYKQYMSGVVKTSLAVANSIYQDAIQCEKLMVELKVAHEMTWMRLCLETTFNIIYLITSNISTLFLPVHSLQQPNQNSNISQVHCRYRIYATFKYYFYWECHMSHGGMAAKYVGRLTSLAKSGYFSAVLSFLQKLTDPASCFYASRSHICHWIYPKNPPPLQLAVSRPLMDQQWEA